MASFEADNWLLTVMQAARSVILEQSYNNWHYTPYIIDDVCEYKK